MAWVLPFCLHGQAETMLLYPLIHSASLCTSWQNSNMPHPTEIYQDSTGQGINIIKNLLMHCQANHTALFCKCFQNMLDVSFLWAFIWKTIQKSQLEVKTEGQKQNSRLQEICVVFENDSLLPDESFYHVTQPDSVNNKTLCSRILKHLCEWLWITVILNNIPSPFTSTLFQSANQKPISLE